MATATCTRPLHGLRRALEGVRDRIRRTVRRDRRQFDISLHTGTTGNDAAKNAARGIALGTLQQITAAMQPNDEYLKNRDGGSQDTQQRFAARRAYGHGAIISGGGWGAGLTGI